MAHGLNVDNHIYYKSGYYYQICKDYIVQTNIHPEYDIDLEYIAFSKEGILRIKEGYAYDGPSGPAIDTKNFMRGSLVHDALFQLLRDGYLGQENVKIANEELRRICREDGMSWIRAQWVYIGVEMFGKKWATSQYKKPILIAP